MEQAGHAFAAVICLLPVAVFGADPLSGALSGGLLAAWREWGQMAVSKDWSWGRHRTLETLAGAAGGALLGTLLWLLGA